jgi:hypothetical protein
MSYIGYSVIQAPAPAAPAGPLLNDGATTDPTTTNDTSEGYSIGSKWINITSGEVFVATDVTLNNAIWTKTSYNKEAIADILVFS